MVPLTGEMVTANNGRREPRLTSRLRFPSTSWPVPAPQIKSGPVGPASVAWGRLLGFAGSRRVLAAFLAGFLCFLLFLGALLSLGRVSRRRGRRIPCRGGS